LLQAENSLLIQVFWQLGFLSVLKVNITFLPVLKIIRIVEIFYQTEEHTM